MFPRWICNLQTYFRVQIHFAPLNQLSERLASRCRLPSRIYTTYKNLDSTNSTLRRPAFLLHRSLRRRCLRPTDASLAFSTSRIPCLQRQYLFLRRSLSLRQPLPTGHTSIISTHVNFIPRKAASTPSRHCTDRRRPLFINLPDTSSIATESASSALINSFLRIWCRNDTIRNRTVRELK